MADWSRVARRIRVPLGFGVAALYLWLAHPTWRSMLWGTVLVIPGLVIRGLASGYVHKNEQLATGGPYAYTRNPLYLGSLVLAIGFAIAARSWWIGMVLCAMFFLIYLPVIRSEEQFLRRHFAHYDAYAKHVPMLIPRGTASSRNDGTFSWTLYGKHREYNAAVGALAIFAALAFKVLHFPGGGPR